MLKKYIVRLTDDERFKLQRLVRTGKTQGYRIHRANIFLAVDANGSNCTDGDAAKALGCSSRTVANLRQRFVEQGFDAALERKQRVEPPVRRKLDGEGEAQLIALSCSEAPEGKSQWALRLLADKLVEMQVVENISHETVRRVLKKRS